VVSSLRVTTASINVNGQDTHTLLDPSAVVDAGACLYEGAGKEVCFESVGGACYCGWSTWVCIERER